jgi:hypothetical protein
MDNDIIKEVAAATGEVAKTTGKALDLTGAAGRFFDRVMGDIVEDGFGLIRDRLRFYRLERAVILASETEGRLRQRGIEHPRIVPPKIALPLIEAASVEDEPELMKLWTELLASAMDPTAPKVEKKLVSILQELSAADAEVLSAIHAEWQDATDGDRFAGITYQRAADGFYSHDAISVVTLFRLGLITPGEVRVTVASMAGPATWDNPVPLHGEEVTVLGNLDVVAMTPLGIAFCKAVRLDRSDTEPR